MSMVVMESLDHAVVSLQLNGGTTNAINETMVTALDQYLSRLAEDASVKAIVLTGNEHFFSFGLDIGAFLKAERSDFSAFLRSFSELYRKIFLYPKPMVAAISGHCLAAGAVLALACDHRSMVAGRTKMALNELGYGCSFLAGSIDILRFVLGQKYAAKVLYSADLFSATEALSLNLIDRVVTSLDLKRDAFQTACRLGSKQGPAFAATKTLLREPILRDIESREAASIETFMDIWYSPETQAKLSQIQLS